MQLEASLNECSQNRGSEEKPERPARVKSIRVVNKASLLMGMVLLLLSGLTIYALLTMDYKNIDLLKGLTDTLANFKTMFSKPHSPHLNIGQALYQLLITLGLAFLTTVLGGIIALFLGLLAARNLSNPMLTNLVKGIIAFIRAVPTILWVLIFAVAAGLGSAAAVIGMTFHSVSYLTKAYSESFEDLDAGTIEALKASGANWWQIVSQAVLPASLSYLISWTFMRFEINFGNAVAMGAVAGAAGIGFELFMASEFYFDLGEVGMITYLILACAMILEAVSTGLKGRLIGEG